jgi:Ion channel
MKNSRFANGWVTPLVGQIVSFLTKPSELILGKRVDSQQYLHDPKFVAKRSVRVDTFVAICMVLEMVAFIFVSYFKPSPTKWIAFAFVTWRATDIAATAIRVTLFDRVAPRPRPKMFVASHERMIILAIMNYVELALCFAVIYAKWPACIHGRSDGLDALHLSFISQLTIGYGDVYPTGFLRVVSWAQGAICLFLLILILGRFVSALKPETSLSVDQEE